ncbi:glucokinase [Prevotella sp. khp1]|uniref:ROK family protein n=1 Tax=Prevotellaceae TaxID=171552 RepID=UPI00089159E3|nr:MULTISPECIES: ROK family protein [Prevotellaceae]QVJ81751.1 ROK family protein [Xylanibacter ruminicola]SDQ53206.1 glucokinase [Prevotella sp. khp1]
MNEQNAEIKPYVIGLDLGGTNSVFGIVDARGDIKATTAIKTGGYSNVDDYVAASVEALQPIIEQVGGIEKIKAMGVGAPNGNYYNGTIEFAPNLPWAHNGVVPLAKLFSDALGIPVALTNDANAAAIGEMVYGVARGMKNFIVITLGTGVGSGIVVNGQLLYGHDGFAGELGHVTMVRGEEGRACGCGRTGCLECYCSATGVARTAREMLAKTDRPSLLRDMNPEDITSLDVSIAAGKGDELAKDIYEFTGKMLGEACADFAAFSSPEAFIFFGGMVKAGELIMKPIREAYDAHVLKIFKNKAKFLVSGLDGASAAVLGASAIGWEV